MKNLFFLLLLPGLFFSKIQSREPLFYERNIVDERSKTFHKALSAVKKVSGSCSEEKARMIMEIVYQIRPDIYVEIGVLSGASLIPALYAMKDMKHGKAYAIDAWSAKVAVEHMNESNPNYQHIKNINYKKHLKKFKKTLEKRKLEDFCKIIHKPAVEASSKIRKPIDILHLDGGVSRDDALLDAQYYLPKVRSGGYILFNNYSYCVDGKLPRKEAFQYILNECNLVDFCDHYNFFVFQKI